MRAPAALRPSRTLTLAGCAAAVTAAALAGCGTGSLRTEQIESTIVRQFRAQGIPLTDVGCKDGAKAEKGARISCTGTNPSGTTLVIEGQVTSIDGDKAAFEAKAVRGVARGTVIADQARKMLEEQVGQDAAGMTCPAKVPIPTKPTVRCLLTTTQGPKYAATVRIDAGSRLEVELDDTPLDQG